jgi:hypothetical protein
MYLKIVLILALNLLTTFNNVSLNNKGINLISNFFLKFEICNRKYTDSNFNSFTLNTKSAKNNLSYNPKLCIELYSPIPLELWGGKTFRTINIYDKD